VHGLILAGGLGSRLAAEGVTVPKAVVPVARRPQIAHLFSVFQRLQLSPIVAMVRADISRALMLAQESALPHGRVVPCLTPSSLHTLALGLDQLPEGPVFCSMVDTVMREVDWEAVHRGAVHRLAEGADAVLAVTPFVDDERALFVERETDLRVRALLDTPTTPTCVTGGVYGFGPRARATAPAAVAEGATSMRAYLRALLARGLRVDTVEIARIIDLDRRADLEQAERWLGGGS
jgi:NDP-sugar pyrophosphorylase family protein